MKTALLLLAFASQVLAAGSKQGELDFVCRSRSTGNHPVVQIRLRQLDHKKIQEGVKIPFELLVETLRPGTKVAVAPAVSYKGFVETEDVQVFFNSLDKRAHLTLFLDELNETYLSFKGQKDIPMDCDEHRW